MLRLLLSLSCLATLASASAAAHGTSYRRGRYNTGYSKPYYYSQARRYPSQYYNKYYYHQTQPQQPAVSTTSYATTSTATATKTDSDGYFKSQEEDFYFSLPPPIVPSLYSVYCS